MTILHISLMLIAALIGVVRAAGERVVDFFSWNHSIFARKYPKEVTVEDLRKETPKFSHPREVSWARKDVGPKWLQTLKHTVLVGLTDLWHFADLATAFAAFILIPLLMITLSSVLWWQYAILLAGMWISYSVFFHLFYHKFFYNDPFANLLDPSKVVINN